MANDFQGFFKGIRLKPIDTTGTSPALPGSPEDASYNVEGALWVYQDKIKSYLAGIIREVVTTDQTQTLSAKTLDAAVIESSAGGSLDVDTVDATLDLAASAATINIGKLDSTTVIKGDLTVEGDVTTVNTSTLDVEDTNITLNKGGDDVSSEGSGLTVERTGTNGSMVYEDALTSKFKVGALGSEAEIATVSDSQNLTNKTLTSPVIDTQVTGSAISTDALFASASDLTLSSSLAIKTYVDAHINLATDAHDASAISVDNTNANITGTDVQTVLEDNADAIAGNSSAIAAINEDSDRIEVSQTAHGFVVGDAIHSGLVGAVNNFSLSQSDTNTTFVPATDVSTLRFAFRYQTGASAESLTSFTAGIGIMSDTSGTLKPDSGEMVAEIWSDFSGTDPLAPVFTGVSSNVSFTEFQADGNFFAINDKTWTFSGVTLDASTTYWVVLKYQNYVGATNFGMPLRFDNGSTANAHLTKYSSDSGASYTPGTSPYRISITTQTNEIGWTKSQADDAATLPSHVVTENTNVNNFVAHKFATVNAPSHGFTVGTQYFTDTATAGTPTATEPTSGFSAPLFKPLDTNTLLVNVHRAKDFVAEDHINDTVGAHAATAISVDDTNVNFTGVTVQAALDDIANTAVASGSTADDHINDTTDAHAASAITNTPAGDIAAITVQAAINELDTEKVSLNKTETISGDKTFNDDIKLYDTDDTFGTLKGDTTINSVVLESEGTNNTRIATKFTGGTGNSGSVTIASGNAIAGVDNSGDVTIETGTSAGGTRGNVNINAPSVLINSDEAVTESKAQTLTNKTFDANGTGNNISNIEVDDLAAGVLDTDLTTVSALDDTLASAKAIKAAIEAVPTGGAGSDTDAIHDNVAGEIAAITEKVAPVSTDFLLIEDSEDATVNSKKRIQIGNLPTGSSSLNGLTDVDTTGKVNNDLLKYDTGTSEWKPFEEISSQGLTLDQTVVNSSVSFTDDYSFNYPSGTANDPRSQVWTTPMPTTGKYFFEYTLNFPSDSAIDNHMGIVGLTGDATLGDQTALDWIDINDDPLRVWSVSWQTSGTSTSAIRINTASNPPSSTADYNTSTTNTTTTKYAIAYDADNRIIKFFRDGVLVGPAGGITISAPDYGATSQIQFCFYTGALSAGANIHTISQAPIADYTGTVIDTDSYVYSTNDIYSDVNMNIGNLSDVDVNTVAPVDGDALVFNSTTGKFEPSVAGTAVSSATESAEGIAEIATQTEVNTGTDDARFITPNKLANSTLANNVTANNAKVSNATHTGEVTGDTALTVQPEVVSNKTNVTPESADSVLLLDDTDSALKQTSLGAIKGLNGDKATYDGTPAGAGGPVSLTADNAGLIGNDISITGSNSGDDFLDTTLNNTAISFYDNFSYSETGLVLSTFTNTWSDPLPLTGKYFVELDFSGKTGLQTDLALMGLSGNPTSTSTPNGDYFQETNKVFYKGLRADSFQNGGEFYSMDGPTGFSVDSTTPYTYNIATDRFSLAVDADTQTVECYLNGVKYGSTMSYTANYGATTQLRFCIQNGTQSSGRLAAVNGDVQVVESPSYPIAGYDHIQLGGLKDVNTLVSEHNTANPTNKLSVNSGGTETVDAGEVVQLSGGSDITQGGIGSLDVFMSESFKDLGSSQLISGQDATFDNGGTLGGTLSDETAAPLSKARSIKYTTNASATSSNNDFFYLPAITLEDKQKGQDVALNFYYKWDGSDDLIEVVVFDDTNDRVLTSSLDLIKASSNAQRYSTSVFIPVDCSSLKVGFHHTGVSESSKELVIDDLELSLNPFTTKSIFEYEELNTYQRANLMTDYAGEWRWNLASMIEEVNTVKGGYALVDDAAGARTKLEIYRDGLYNIACAAWHVASYPMTILRNGTDVLARGDGDGATARGQVNWHGELKAGDFITFCMTDGTDVLNIISSSTMGGSTQTADIRVLGQYESEHVVTPAKSNMTDWTSYTPTTQGLGTISSADFKYRRVGTNIEISGYMITGTCTAVEAQITLPTGLTIDSSVGSNIVNGVGKGGTGAYGINVITTGGDAFLNFNQHNVGNISPGTGNGIFYNSAEASFFVSVPIEEWGNDVQFLAAVPVQKVAYVKHVVSSGVASGDFNLGAYRTRPLNTVEGDAEIVSLNSNQFTLSKGKYRIEASASTYEVNFHKLKLRNITDSTDDILGLNESSVTPSGSSAHLDGIIEITENKIFELQHRCSSSKSGNGFGAAASFGDDEVYAQVKITKIK